MRITGAITLVLMLLPGTAVLGDVTHSPDANTLWVEDFDPFEAAPDSRAGWFAFEPAEVSAEQVGGLVRFREVSEFAGGSIQRILPLGGADYRYLQIRIAAVENPEHYFKAWLRLPAEGNPQLGRMGPGISTVDLGRFPFLAAMNEVPLDLAVIGPRGRLPSGAVDVDWVRLVKSPVGGLTVELIDEGEADGIAQIGDTLAFTYTADRPVDGPIAVTCHLAADRTTISLTAREQVLLTDDGQGGDAAAGDGIFTRRVTISPQATELTARAADVIATAGVAGESRNAPALFAFSILPAPWRAARAAESVGVGEEIFSEDFATSDAHNWRAWSGGWEVVRPEEGAEGTIGLGNRTYDRPRPEGHWIELPTAPVDDAALSAALRPQGGAGPIMLALRFQDPWNHYRLRIAGSTQVAIERVCAGWQEVLAETTLAEGIRRPAGEPAPLVTFTAAGSTLIASVEGAPVLHAYDNTFTTGRAALGLNRLNGRFDSVALHAASAHEPPADFPWAGLRLRLGLRERDRAFGRDAGTIGVPASIENWTAGPVGPLRVVATLIRQSLYADPVAEVAVNPLAAGESTNLRVPLDPARYRSGRYALVLRLRAGEETVATDAVALEIGPPVPAERMDVLWWGGANVAEQVEAVAAAGVTVMHEFGQRSPDLLALGTRLGLTYYSYPPRIDTAPAEIKANFENPHASPHAPMVDELDPEAREWALQVARDHARSWRSNRRLRYILLNTEYEGHSYPNLSAEAEARYRERLGFPRPAEAVAPYIAPATSLELFPDRIIPDDAPLYRWFRFFYAEGGGALNGITCDQARAIEEIFPQVTTFHDPVLRGPQFAGRWDGMELLNHWTYVERNPLDVAAFADELACLGRRSGWRQQISQMIQVIAYADSAMPGLRPDAPEYLRDAPFVAIPPDILTEAVWLVMSRPVDMIAFHGLQTAIETQEQETYRYTNPNTLSALGRVTEALIEPYGPALRRIKDRPGPRVALLLSAANTVFGRIAEGGGTRSLHNPLTAARLGVDVLYDADVQEGALAKYSVLAIPQCRFLLASVRERIDEFQRAGGTVLLDGDAMLEIPGAITLPEVAADHQGATLELVPGEVIEVGDSPRARLDADLRLAAAALRERLLPRLGEPPFVDSPHPYVVLDARRSGELSYIFAINDRRIAGPYLGRFGAVLERGVPITATVELCEAPGALYDALQRRQLGLSATESGGSAVDVQLEPGWGALLVACVEPLGPAELTVSDRTEGSGPVTVRVQARYASGRDVAGVVPLRVDVFSPDGALNDYSRFTATEADGSLAMSVPIADNEPAGLWAVRVTELVGGHVTVAGFQVVQPPARERIVEVAPGLRTLALWRFDADAPAQEAFGREYQMTLRGRSRFADDGRSGGCLECFASIGDDPEGVAIAQTPALSPTGRFAAELWLRPKPEMADAEFTMLLDCNYYLNTRELPGANTGYAFFLRRDPEGVRPTLVLGFGDRTVTIKAQPVALEAGAWRRLGFAYDGAGGVSISLDGREVGRGRIEDAGDIAPARLPLIIGGRVGSTHYGCAGAIDDVRLSGE